jgi:hypothetical protein
VSGSPLCKCAGRFDLRGFALAFASIFSIAACERAKVEPITPHVLKHTSISWMVMSGTFFERIAAFTNTSKDVVERVYGKISPSFLRDIAQAVSF